MLITRSSAISIAILTAGATVAMAGPASAGGGGGSKQGWVWAGGGSRTTAPVRSAPRGGGGGGGGSSKAAPMPCPAGAVCGQTTAGNAPAPAAVVPTIDVATLARAGLQLPYPTVHTSPANKTYVQLRTGLWIGQGDYGTFTADATAGGTTVRAIANPNDVTWRMGESTVTCHSPGSKSGRTCGYTYQRSSAGQPNGKYAISVTTTWNISWVCVQGTCDAPSGGWGPNSTMSRTTDAALAVGEVQTESRPG